MRRRSHDAYQAWLWGEALLLALLAAALTLFVAYPTLREPYELPEVRLFLDTTVMLAALIVAVLAGIRLTVDRRWIDLLLCAGFSTAAATNLAFSVVPMFVYGSDRTSVEGWAWHGGRMLSMTLIALAPFVHGRIRKPRLALSVALPAAAAVLAGLWVACRLGQDILPAPIAGASGDQPLLLTATLAIAALLGLAALVGFWRRYRDGGEDLDRWLALASTLVVFAEVHNVLTPLPAASYVSHGDFLRVVSYGVLLAGVWRAIRSAEFGRAVAEERARVAREIHDGLQQYLFSLATHLSMLKPGQVSDATIDQLRGAVSAAQQEARFAVLALGTASGNAPFDAALRRYVDVLTADGALEVDLEIDTGIRLAPDEQIEIFRIVQESLANVRKHANASHAEVHIGRVNGRRSLVVSDDGEGFESEPNGAGQGLQNIRRRVTSIGGAFALRSEPGHGTALQVDLRS